MGVLVERIPHKGKSGFFEKVSSGLAGALSAFAGFADNFGLAVSEREVLARRESPGRHLVEILDGYGVIACEKGTDFWKAG